MLKTPPKEGVLKKTLREEGTDRETPLDEPEFAKRKLVGVLVVSLWVSFFTEGCF